MAKRKELRYKKIKLKLKIRLPEKIRVFFWEAGAKVIFVTDTFLDKVDDFLKEIVEDIKEIIGAGAEGAVDLGAAIIRWYDKSAEVVEWFIKKTTVIIMREYHDLLINLAKHRKAIVKECIIVLLVGVGAVAIFASAIDYEYAYNGKMLGIVKEQRDVLEILEMVSDELSLEYGSKIAIDPETDITFKPVISSGKDIDDADTVK